MSPDNPYQVVGVVEAMVLKLMHTHIHATTKWKSMSKLQQQQQQQHRNLKQDDKKAETITTTMSSNVDTILIVLENVAFTV